MPSRLTFASHSRGFTIIEFMIAITLSLLVLAALTGAFVANSRSRAEIERANQQMENGRFALQLLTDDLQLAGFYGQLNLRNATTLVLPGSKPNPCATAVASLNASLLLHIQGYDNLASLPSSLQACLGTDFKPNTDVLVVRRTATCESGATNCAPVTGAPYFQASLCGNGNELGDPDDSTKHFRLDTNPGNLTRTRRDCATAAAARQFLTHIYFIANNDRAGDGIPTLKRAELTAVGGTVTFTVVPLAHGIEDLQVEYGIDTDGTGVPWTGDGIPNVFHAGPDTTKFSVGGAVTSTTADCAANSDCMRNWGNVMAVRLYLLARNTTASQDYADDKAYFLGRDKNGNVQCAAGSGTGCVFSAPANKFKRHVYSTSVRLNNPSGRRIS